MEKLLAQLEVEEHFFDLLDTILNRGNTLYQQYLRFGKKFIYAEKIKENNEKVVELIRNHVYLIDPAQRDDLMSIIYHVDSWRAQWDLLYESTRPKPNDEFAFDSIVKFPKNSLERLNDYYYSSFNKKFTQ